MLGGQTQKNNKNPNKEKLYYFIGGRVLLAHVSSKVSGSEVHSRRTRVLYVLQGD